MNKDKLRYSILREVSEGNTPLTEENFEVNEAEFDDAVNYLTREKYLVGVYWADDRPHLDMFGPSVTQQGEKYLKENSLLSKTYKGLKEIRDWLK